MRYTRLGLCIVFTGFLVAILGMPLASAQERPSLSTDEFLEYSLDALRSKMDAAVDENRQISTRNASIRNRVLFLREEMRAMDDEMIQLKEETADLRNIIRQQSAELKLEEKKFNNFFERKRHLEFERDLLKKRMETSRLERGILEQDVQETSFDLKELKSPAQGLDKSQLLNFFAEEKLKFLEMMKEYQKRIAESQDRLDGAELMTAGHLRAKETALRQQEQLERQVSQWELQLKEEQARTGLLTRDTERLQDAVRTSRLGIETENFNRREYQKQLTMVIQDMQEARDHFYTRFADDEEELKRIIALLQEENQALFDYQKVLEDQQRLTQAKDNEEHTTLLVTQQQRDLDQHQQEVVAELHDMRTAVADQSSVNAALQRDEERLLNELADLTNRVEQVKQSAAVIREDAFGQKKAALDLAFQEQHERIKKIEEELALVESDGQRQKETMMTEQDRGLALETALADITAQVQELEKINSALMQEQRAISLYAINQLALFKKSIAEARLSKRAIEASYDVIQKKYEAGVYEAKAFEAEQAELSRYLEVLKNENTAFKKRLAELNKNDDGKSHDSQVLGDGL